MKILFEISVFSEGTSSLKGRIIENYISALRRIDLIKRLDFFLSFPINNFGQLALTDKDNTFIGIDNVPPDEEYDLLILSDAFLTSDWIHLKNLSKIKFVSGFVFNTTDFYWQNWKKNSGSVSTELQLALFYELLYHFDKIMVPFLQVKTDLQEKWGISPNKISVLSPEPILDYSTFVPFKRREASVVLYSEDEFNPDTLKRIFDLFNDHRTNPQVSTECCLIVFSDSNDSLLRAKLKNELSEGTRVVFLTLLSDAEKAQIIGDCSVVIFGKRNEIKFLESSILNTPFILYGDNSTEALESDIPAVKNPKELILMLEKLLTDKSYWEQILEKCRTLCRKTKGLVTDLDLRNNLLVLKESAQQADRKKKVALFGCLPPYQSGIARFNLNWLSSSSDEFCFFVSADNFLKFTNYERGSNKLTVVLENLYEFVSRNYEIRGKIFILGNSYHNLSTLNASMSLGDKESWFYLHEAYLNDLLVDYCDSISVPFYEIYRFFYKKETNGVGVKVLLSLTPISKFIVNNERCKKLIQKEAKNIKEVTICKVFLPLPVLPDVKTRRKEYREGFLVGTFGIPTDLKLTNVIIDAVTILFELGYSIKLIVAGYKTDCYFAGRKIPQFIEVVDSPSYFELLAMEKTVDLAIQLRKVCNGESSGVVSELISLGTPTITVQDLAGEKQSTYLKIVPESISSKRLAEIMIEEYLEVPKGQMVQSNESEVKTLLSKFSMKNLTDKILNILSSNKG